MKKRFIISMLIAAIITSAAGTASYAAKATLPKDDLKAEKVKTSKDEPTEAIDEATDPTEAPEISEDTPQKTEKDKRQQKLNENKAAKLEAKQRMREMKQLAKEAKMESHTYLKEMRKLFTEIDKEDRAELLEEIAAVKAELKDCSIDTFVKGMHLDFKNYDNVLPCIENGRTLVPVRAIAEFLGSSVSWDNETQEITISKDDTVITMTIGSTTAYVNGEEKELDTAPAIKNGRTLVPARFIAESFNLSVDWDENSKSVIID